MPIEIYLFLAFETKAKSKFKWISTLTFGGVVLGIQYYSLFAPLGIPVNQFLLGLQNVLSMLSTTGITLFFYLAIRTLVKAVRRK